MDPLPSQPTRLDEAVSFEAAEWSERLTSRRVGWLGAAAVGSIPALVTFFSFSSLLLLFQNLCFSFLHEIISILALFSCLSPFSSSGSSWLLCLSRFFPFFLPLTNPIDRVSPNRCLKARHEAVSFEAAEWSERLTSRRVGWLGAAAVGSIPALVTFFSFSSLLLLFLSWHFTCFSLFFFLFLNMFAAEMQHYPTVLQRKTSIQCLEHTVSRTAWACGEPEKLFFLAQIIFFHPAA